MRYARSTPMLPGLSSVAGKSVVAKYNGGHLSSDGGLLLLREAEQRLKVADRLAACINDTRDPALIGQRLSTPVSADTLIRLLRRRAAPTPATVRVFGIDDFAWQKGQRYGTIVCDLEKRCVIDLLPDR